MKNLALLENEPNRYDERNPIGIDRRYTGKMTGLRKKFGNFDFSENWHTPP